MKKGQMTNEEMNKGCEEAVQIAEFLMDFIYKSVGDESAASIPMGFLIAAMISFDLMMLNPDQEAWNDFSNVWPFRDAIRQRMLLCNMPLDAETKH